MKSQIYAGLELSEHLRSSVYLRGRPPDRPWASSFGIRGYCGDMRIDFQQNQRYVTATLTPDESDRVEHGKAKLGRKEATFEMPNDYRLHETHPDLLALAALAIASPWVVKSLTLPFPVSRTFAETTAQQLKIQVTNVSTAISHRQSGPESRPGLSFSAGVDSLACLELMPDTTVPVFSHRSPPPMRTTSRYKDDAPLYAIEKMNELGRETHKVTSDLEWVRQPVGFGVDPSPAIPLILMGDYFNLDAIAFGTIAEAAYRTGTEHFINYAERIVFTKWQGAFQAAGLDYFNAVAPLSELGTTKVTRESRFGHLAQSCVRGIPGQPCRQCVKCFRKSLIESSMEGIWPSSDEVSRMMKVRSIKNYLSDAPIRLEVVLMAALGSYQGDDQFLTALRERVGPDRLDTTFTGAWYAPGMRDMVPQRYLTGVQHAASKYIPRMSPRQERAFENFDIRAKIEEDAKAGRIDKFREFLAANT